MAVAGNIIRSTVAAPRIPIGLQPIGSAAQHEVIPWRIAKQMPDSGNKAESAIAVELGTTAVELEIIVAEPEIVQALGRATGARIVEEAVGTASETEAYRREQTALPGEVPLADREAAPAAHVRAVREVRRAWAAEAVAVAAAAAVAGEGDNP